MNTPEALLCAESLEANRPMVRRNNRAAKELRRLHEQNQKLLGALKFYADIDNWKSPSTGFALQYDPDPAPIHKDRGDKARAAIGDQG